MRPLVSESKQLLTESVKSLSGQYAYDAKLADDIAKSPDLLLPAEPIATRLYEFGRRSKALRKELLITLAGSEKDVAHNIGFEVTPEESAQFQIDLSVLYTQSLIEAKIYADQKKSVGVLE